MEKNITNAILLSATVLTVGMIVFPPMHLSAQDDVEIDEKVNVRKVVVESIDFGTEEFIVSLEGNDDMRITVRTNASTTYFFGNGEETELPSLRPGTNIYLFGGYEKDSREIEAEKVVIRNKRITERTAPSRAQMARETWERGFQPATPDFDLLSASRAR